MHRAGVQEFEGLRISQDPTAAQRYGLNRVFLRKGCGQILMDYAGHIGAGSNSGGGNSGFQALNLALQFGAARVILVGFDMNLAGGVHWHGRHEARLNNPTDQALARWAEALDGQAAAIAALGVEVVNASPSSSLGAYPKRSLAEALGA